MLNRLETDAPAASTTAGDVPERLRRRYLTEERGGRGLGFYVDATATAPAFRDQGRRLATDRNDPHVVRDLVAIAVHRGWGALSVRGQTDFRREVWLAARTAGLEVRGYQPTSRDEQDLARRRERAVKDRSRAVAPPTPDLDHGDPRARLRIVEAVVRSRIEPGEQSRIIAAARSRLASWLERRADFSPAPRPLRKERDRRA
jgi:hypothetical protein